jgi:ATP-dependent helicase/nuclease subunit B
MYGKRSLRHHGRLSFSFLREENDMSLRFILGRSGTGKTELVFQDIRDRLIADPAGPPIVYLVPEQMTFQSEYALVNSPGIEGMIRAQVFSFTRLAWRVLQETGGISRYHLNNVGMNMLIRKIIEQRKHELKVFGKASEKSGFVEQTEELLTEFKRYCLQAGDISQVRKVLEQSAENQNQAVLAEKLHDLQLIYQDLELHLLKKYVDSEDYLRLLAEKIPQSAYIKDAEIYIDGFHSFTLQELTVIEQLMKSCRRVTVALTVDKPYEDYPPHELHLFRMTGTTYQKIREIALANQVDIEEPIQLREAKRYQHPSLKHLEQYFEARPTVPYTDKTAITLTQAVNRRAEIEGIARELIRLVREERYRFRDMAILVRNTEDYYDLIETIFEDYKIPFFIDQKRSMLNHPLIELIRSSLEVVTKNWRYEAIFRCVKTDLLFPVGADVTALREDMDKLENYVLAYGIQGTKWTRKDRWTYRRFHGLEDDQYVQTDREKEMEEKINQLREMIVKPLYSLQKRLSKAENGLQLCEALYLFLEELQVREKLDQWRLEAEQKGELSAAREHEQVWNEVIDLLDQFVELLGEEKVSLQLFVNMLDTGFESIRSALVPPAMDQVLVANFERSRLTNVKCAFIIGANDGVIPAKPKEGGILTETDRELLQEAGVQLAPGSRQQLLDEQFLIYLAFTTASERLYVSYPLANDEGKALLPSIMIKRLKDFFPNLDEKLYTNDPAEYSDEEQFQFLVNPTIALSYLSLMLQGWKKQYPLPDFWWDVYNYYAESERWKKEMRLVLGSLFFKNKAEKLSDDVSRQLYGEHIQASVSRMELFQGCPFSHFAQYGLKLKERQIYRLEAPDIGQMFHAALKMIADRLREQSIDWRDLTKDQCEQLSMEVVEQLAPRLQREILLSSNRHHYIKRKLQKIISRASSVLSEHAKASGFVPVGLELSFGKGGPLPPMKFQLNNGCTMELVGRIDRVDKAESSKGILLRVVDYKSSQKDLNLAEVYYGLALQMLTYLDVIVTNAKKWLGVQATPAGVLYFHIHDPMINAKSFLPEDQLEEEIFKRFKMKGLLLEDEEAVRLMDQTLETGHSKIVAAAIKKNGEFYSSSSVASEDEFLALRNHVKHVFKKAGTEIISGVIDIAPFKLKDKTPCTFCPFKAVCQFDQSLEENDYRLLTPEKNDVILEKLRKGAFDHVTSVDS